MSTSLTPSRRKRIRCANAALIAWMIDKEHYWSPEAHREILKRVQELCYRDPAEGLAAAESARVLLERRHVEPAPDLVGLTEARYAMALRYSGQVERALDVYGRALEIEGLSPRGRSEILARMAVALVCAHRTREGVDAVDEAVRLSPGNALILATRGWVHMVEGNLDASLRDSLAVLELLERPELDNWTFLSAVMNAANALSYEAGAKVERDVIQRLLDAIKLYRKSLPSGGSSFYKMQRVRHLLSRTQALLCLRLGEPEKAIYTLRPVVEGLRKGSPDEALDASVDLMCLLAKVGETRAAAEEARRALGLIEVAKTPLSRSAVNILRANAQSVKLTEAQAVELRLRLRSRDPLSGVFRAGRVA